jgi:lipopolysaccharide assembly protein A
VLKKIGAILITLIIFGAMLVFTRLNPGMIEVDLAFGTVEASMALAFTVAVAAGWLFGVLCMLLIVLRLVNERRRLRKAVRSNESEISSLRSMPLNDAD